MEGSASSTAAVCSMCDRAAVYAFEGDAASLCERHQPIDPVEALTKVGGSHFVACMNCERSLIAGMLEFDVLDIVKFKIRPKKRVSA